MGVTHWSTPISLFIVIDSCQKYLALAEWRRLLHLLEMQTVIKQAICVSVLQMYCKTRANERKENLLSFPSAVEFDLGQIWK